MSEKAPPIPSAAAALHRRFLSTDRGMVERFGDPFRPLEPECGVIQFNQPLTPSQLQRAGDLIADRPDVELYVYGKASKDLGFLRHFERARRLHLALYDLDDIGGFSFLQGGLEELTFGQTKKEFSLGFVESFPRLKKLFLVGHRKDLQAIRALGDLASLGLSGITLPDLSLLLPLAGLRKLAILLGGTTNLSLLPRLSRLEDLFLMRITKLSDLSVLGDLPCLKTLRLDWMRNVTSLPNLAGLARLDYVTLDTMKGLADLSPLAAAPALRRLAIASMPKVQWNITAGTVLKLREVLLWGISLLLMLGLHFFVRRTRLGKAMQATAQDQEAARMMGIEVDTVVMTTFFLGSALAGAAGLIFGLYYNFASYVIGYTAGLRAFTAAVLGGIGSIPGAMLGGVIIGLIESLGGQLIATRWTDVIIFSILVIVLVLRPTGLFGRMMIRKS